MRPTINQLIGTDYDFVVIGAGINGAVSAAALSSAGLRVLLVDKGDYAGFTSQESSNMVWGGIKYLQSLEFALVFKLCRSRARLMRNYPNRIRQIGFLAAIGDDAPANLIAIWMGSLLYWFIGLFSTKAPKVFDRTATNRYEPGLTGQPIGGSVQYFDGLLVDNDARFVWDFVSRAKGFGAVTRNYTQLTSATRQNGSWSMQLKDAVTGETANVLSKALINAAGPFAMDVSDLLKTEVGAQLVFSKGIHLIVPRLTEDDRVLAFWDEQGRLFYVLPMHDRSVIGTTDTRVDSPLTEVTDEDREFVLRQINKSLTLAQPLTKDDIIAERCGVRPLVATTSRQRKNAAEIDWHKMSRKHVISTDKPNAAVSIYGGKLTDCINVGQEVLTEAGRLGFKLNHKKWYGESKQVSANQVAAAMRAKVGDEPWVRLVAAGLHRRQGAGAIKLIEAADSTQLAPVFEGLDFCRAELKFIAVQEDVVTPEDLLRRRTPLALIRSAEDLHEAGLDRLV